MRGTPFCSAVPCGVELTVTDFEMLFVAPSLSVTFSVTVYAPAAA